MRPTAALLRAAIPSRIAMLGPIVFVALFGRLLVDGTWESSDATMVMALVLQFGVLPVYAAMLGTALVRGEHATWSWALARPMSRSRWLATCVVIDAAFLATATLLIDVTFPDLPQSLLHDVNMAMAFGLPAPAGGPFALAMVYLAGAFGGTRGHQGLRAFPVAFGYLAAFATLTAVIVWADDALASFFLVDAWRTHGSSPFVSPDSTTHHVAARQLAAATIPLAILGAAMHVVVRGLRSLPSTLQRRDVIVLLAVWSVVAGVLTWGMHSRLWVIADAPILARRGDASVVVFVGDRDDHHLVVLAERDCDDCFARVASLSSIERRPAGLFEDVVAGAYQICNAVSIGVTQSFWDVERWDHWSLSSHLSVETCIDIEVAEGETRVELPFDPASTVSSPQRPHGYAGDRRMELLLVPGVGRMLTDLVEGPVEYRDRARYLGPPSRKWW